MDSGIEAGSLISVYYDSLLAKVVSWGESREEARETLVQGLNGYHLEGVTTNSDFINAILTHPAFITGDLSTDFVAEHFEKGRRKLAPATEVLHYMIIAATLIYHNRNGLVRESLKSMATHVGLTPKIPEWVEYMVKAEDDLFTIRIFKKSLNREWAAWVDGEKYQVKTPEFEFFRRRLRLKIDDKAPMFRLQYQGNFIRTSYNGVVRTFEIYTPREWRLSQYMPRPKEAAAENYLSCPMPGLVVTILAKPGDRVFQGQDLVSIESMKMESFVASPCDGEVDRVLVRPGQAVETGEVLLTFKNDPPCGEAP